MFGGLRGAVARFVANDGFLLGAGLAFFFLICMIPLLLIAVSMVGFVLSSEEAAREIVGQLSRNFPVYKTEITRALLRIVQTRRASGVLGTAVLILFSTSLFSAARLMMHRMLGVRTHGGLVRNFVVDAIMVPLLGVLLFGGTLATWVFEWFQHFVLEPAQVSTGWIGAASIALSLGFSTVLFYLGYRHVPRRRVRRASALAGSLLTSVLWEGAKQLFRLYIRQVGVYDQIYGPVTVLVASAMFIYYSAVVFVFGAAYVASLEARRH